MSDAVVSFCVGTGRCGTTFLAELAAMEPAVAASHERLRLAATFHMYCKWHGIAVDPEGALIDRDAAVARDLVDHRVSFEASALLSHSVVELFERFERFDVRFLLLVRSPIETVASFAARGWFVDPIAWRDASLPPTIRDAAEPRHFFGRNLPRGGAELERFRALSQIGKIAWFWQARNRAVLDQFRQLPRARCRIARLEDLDFAHYQDVAAFLGWTPEIDRARFDALAATRPNASEHPPVVPAQWSAESAVELECEVRPVARALGYEHRVAQLRDGAPPITTPSAPLEDALAALDAP